MTNTKQLGRTAQRILSQIEKHSGVTSVGLVASDLRLHFQTVKRYVTAMIREGYVQRGHDGNALELTDAYAAERRFERDADAALARAVAS